MYSQIYPGIDAAYYGNGRQLEFDFVVAAAPMQIKSSCLSTARARSRSMKNGNILVNLAGQEILIKRPDIYQREGGLRVSVKVGLR